MNLIRASKTAPFWLRIGMNIRCTATCIRKFLGKLHVSLPPFSLNTETPLSLSLSLEKRREEWRRIDDPSQLFWRGRRKRWNKGGGWNRRWRRCSTTWNPTLTCSRHSFIKFNLLLILLLHFLITVLYINSSCKTTCFSLLACTQIIHGYLLN